MCFFYFIISFLFFPHAHIFVIYKGLVNRARLAHPWCMISRYPLIKFQRTLSLYFIDIIAKPKKIASNNHHLWLSAIFLPPANKIHPFIFICFNICTRNHRSMCSDSDEKKNSAAGWKPDHINQLKLAMYRRSDCCFLLYFAPREHFYDG